MTDASPPKFLSLPEIMVAAKKLEDIALVHEIAVNENFKLQPNEPPNDSFMKQVKDTMHKAFWDLLRDQLNSDPPEYSQAMILLTEIRDSLLSLLLDQHTKVKDEINHILDVQFIQNQIDNNSLDFEYYTRFILNLMKKMCAPVRDESINSLTILKDPVEVFKGIVETLSLMKLDMANFTITAQKRAFNACSAEYEREKFAEYLKVKPDALNLTEEWLKRHINLEIQTEPYEIIITRAYMEIFHWDENIVFPEALALDKERYLSVNRILDLLIITASAFIVTISSISNTIPNDPAFKELLKNHILVILKDSNTVYKNNCSLLPNIVEQAIKDTNEYLESINRSLLSQDVMNTIESQVLCIMEPEHKIRTLVERRFKEFIMAVISCNNAIPQQCPLGLSAFKDELASVTGSFLQLVTYNRKVFSSFYKNILNKYLNSSDTL
ncbi:T-complex protein 11-like protein 1 isoform X2 [Daktulosphaira vitifoliae]|nr:T-complex protein 11-like protein 1 isoform X2 [Daktulosphaira vitifoliae]